MGETNQWQKLGLIFKPGMYDWMHSHAQNPLPEPLKDGLCRVHFSTRDRLNRSRGGYFTFNPDQPSQIFEVSPTPTIDLGYLGAFDDSGVMPGSIVDCGSHRYMYYTGWSKAVDVPFLFHIGLAVSEDGGATYRRVSPAPVLGRNHHDPYITGAPYVLLEGGVFRMWYISGTKWAKESESEKPKHYYTIKYAESLDGINWKTSDHLCINYQEGEYAIARPIVWRTQDGYRMWFTFRSNASTYRIGVADSRDGVDWIRQNRPLSIDVSQSGWDSEMICYAHPFEWGGRRFALYNGNGYGSDGAGLAVLSS